LRTFSVTSHAKKTLTRSEFIHCPVKIIIHPRCTHAQEEARVWSYRRDRLTGDVLPDVADGSDHCWDAVRYALGPLVRPTNSAEIWRRLCG